MQYVLSDLPPAHPTEEPGTPRVVRAQAAKDGGVPPVVPMVFNFKPQEKRRKKALPEDEAESHVFRERNEEERRKYCRRLHNTPILYDIRVVNDRRRKNQRKDDITTSVDEIV